MRHTRSGHPSFPAWKFEAPRLGACLLSRERLLGRVEQCLGKAKSNGDILLVSAPAGYGKSTLLAEWSRRATLPVVWYHLDRSDQDPATLIRGIAHALRTRFPRPRWSVETVLNNLRVDLLADADLARVSSVLADDIEQHVARPAVLILTGVAELGVKSPSIVVLDRLLSRPIDHLRVALEWREAPRVHFSTLLAERRLTAIGSEDLLLTDAELEELLTLAGASRDPVYREQVRSLSTGWVTGAMLAIGALLPEVASPLPAGEVDHDAVVNYLARQVIDVLPHTLSAFASEAAVLSYMTPDLCARLFGLPVRTARERLGALERTTGFLTRSGQRPQELVYRFQPLLREALLARLGSLPRGMARRRDLHLRAGSLLQESGDVDAAIWQYTQVRSYDRIADLIETVESEYLRASRGLLLARWLDLLPASVYQRRPHLQLLQAELYRQTGRGSQALKLVKRLEKRLLEPEAQPSQPVGSVGTTAGGARIHRLAAHALVINAEVQYQLGRYNESRQACADALAQLSAAQDAGAEKAVLDGLYARTYESLAAAVLLTDGPDAAEPHLRVCEHHTLYTGDLWKVGRHHYHRTKVYMREGNFTRAEPAAVAALLAAEEAHDEICAVASRLNLGAIKMRLGRAGEAREELATALDEARAVGYTLGEVYALGNLADLAVSSGAYAEAIPLYDETFRVLGSAEDRHMRLCASAGLGYALTLTGRPEEAIVRLTPLLGAFQAEAKGSKRHISSDDVVVALSLGFAYLRHGLSSFARELFARAAQEAILHGQALKAAQAHLFQAAVQVSESDQLAAEAEVMAALDSALATHDGLALAVELRRVPEVWPLLDRLNHPLAQDLMRAVRAGSRVSCVTSLTREIAEQAPVGVEAEARAAESIRVYMFGAARILVGTSYVTRWKKPAARDLFLFLLHEQRPVSRETILSALWPDADPEVSDGWFRQARYHLQHTLARDCLIQDASGLWRLELDCWIDVRETERLAEEGMRLIATGETAAGVGCLRQALTLWHESYLDDLYVDWTAERRDALYHRRLTLLEQLAVLELEAGFPDKAAQLYQQILATEPFYESAHRGLMNCFVARGEPSRAIQHFRAYSHLLRDGLDTTPAAETLALCASILSEMHSTSRVFAEAMSRVSSSI